MNPVTEDKVQCRRRRRRTDDPKKTKRKLQGVFVFKQSKAEFVPVVTGHRGPTAISKWKRLEEGDEIVDRQK